MSGVMAAAVLMTPGALAQGQSDNLIVPGQRVGAVYIGMPLADLYRVMGEPTSSTRMSDGFEVWYLWADLGVAVSVPGTRAPLYGFNERAAGSVVMKIVAGRNQHTAEGLGLGSSLMALQAKLGNADRTITSTDGSRAATPEGYFYCYRSGINVRTATNGVVDQIAVWRPGCDKRGLF